MTRALLVTLLLLPACGEETAVKDLRALEFLEEVGVPVCPSTATQLVKTYYVNCYQDEWVVARWVGYRISAPELEGPGERKNNFKEDPELPATTRADNNDYEAYYDRGHLAPAGDFQRNQEAMDETFYLSNMAPQEPNFNRGPWADFEAAVRDMVRTVQVAWVYTGNLFLDDAGQPTEPLVRIGRHGVGVPTHNWKVALGQRSDGSHQAFGYILPNTYPAPTDWWTYNVPVDEVEGLTGLDFFGLLSDNVENAVEAATSPLPASP